MGFDCLEIILKPDFGVFVKNLATHGVSLGADLITFNFKSKKQDQQIRINKLRNTNLTKIKKHVMPKLPVYS